MAKKDVFLPYSFEEGLDFMERLAADPFIPFEGHYFFNGRAWYNITDHDLLRFQATGKLDPLLIFVTSTLSSIEEITRISNEFKGGVFAHYHPVPALMNIGIGIKQRAYEILGLPPPRPYDKNKNILCLPSAQDLYITSSFKIVTPAEKDFRFCVCSDEGTVFFAIDDAYAARLREMKLAESREILLQRAREYQECCDQLSKDRDTSLADCISAVSGELNKDEPRFVFSFEKRKKEVK